MRNLRVLLTLVASLALVMVFAAPVSAWNPDVSQKCVDGVSVSTVTLHADLKKAEYSLDGKATWTEYKNGDEITVEGSATLWQRQRHGGDDNDTANGDDGWSYLKTEITAKECPKPTPTPKPTLPTFDTSCEAITVSGVTEGWQFIVEPGDLLLGNGKTELKPGDYTYGLRYNGDDQDSGKFTIEACATPTPVPTPTPEPPVIVHFLKQVEGGDAVPADFVMHLTGDESFWGVDGDTIEIPAGTYTLTEDQLPNYFSEFGGGCYQNTQPDDVLKAAKAVEDPSPSFTFAAGEEWTCGFRNTYDAPEPTETPAPSVTPAPTDEPTPEPTTTLPPTDTISNTSGTSGPGTGLWLVLAGLAGLVLGATFLLSPKRK